MNGLLVRAGLRYYLRHPWLLVLSVLGVALGVAVVVAVDVANGSALRAFDLSVQAVAGRATHQVVGGPSGISGEAYRHLRVDQGLRPAAPVVEGTVQVALPGGGAFRLLGVDLFAEAPFRPYVAGAAPGMPIRLLARPGAVVLSRDAALRLGVGVGDRLPLEPLSASLEVAALLEPSDPVSRQALDGLLVTDLATAQEVLGRPGLDRIELILEPGDEERVRSLLPPDLALEEAGSARRALRRTAGAFQANLQALGFLALIVGMFLIYNSVAFSVVQRRELLGTLRALGVARREILALVLAEAAALGLAGTLLGEALGVGLARFLVDLVTRTLNDLYFSVAVRQADLPSGLLARDALLGLASTLAAAAVPALEASLSLPRGAMRRSDLEVRIRRLVPRGAVLGLLLAGLSLAGLALPFRGLPWALAASTGLVLGTSLLVPALGAWLLHLMRKPAGQAFGLVGPMAAEGAVASLSRTAVALTALTLAVAVTIGMAVMVDSFRTTFAAWLDHYLAADVYVAATGSGTLPSETVEALRTAPGVAASYRYRRATVNTPRGPATLVATEFDSGNRGALRFVEGGWEGFAEGGALVSEPFSWKWDVHPGDRLRLRTLRGLRDFPVVGVYSDFGSDQGVVMLHRETYLAWWEDPGVSSVGLIGSPGVEPRSLAEEARRLARGQDLRIRSNRDLRQASMAVFERTFTVTRVLRLLALAVAFVGVLTALMALQLERSREVALLRALGLTPGQVWGLAALQTVLLGLVAGLLALPQGAMLGAVALRVLQKRSFGWTLEFHLDPGLLAQALLLALGAAVLAGLYPGWRMSRAPLADALRDE